MILLNLYALNTVFISLGAEPGKLPTVVPTSIPTPTSGNSSISTPVTPSSFIGIVPLTLDVLALILLLLPLVLFIVSQKGDRPSAPGSKQQQFLQTLLPGLNRLAPLLIVVTIGLLLLSSVATLLASASPPSTQPSPATPTAIPYPTLPSSYLGTVHNGGKNQDGNMSIVGLMQDHQGNIKGNINIGLPLTGSGLFIGTIKSHKTIQFTVTSTINAITLPFTGSIAADNSISGTYTAANGPNNTWRAKPNLSPVVYPILASQYEGTYQGPDGKQNGKISLTDIKSDQQNISGNFSSDNSSSAPFNGTVGEDNNIKFTALISNIPIDFVGNIHDDGSLGGTYTSSIAVGKGNWNLSPKA